MLMVVVFVVVWIVNMGLELGIFVEFLIVVLNVNGMMWFLLLVVMEFELMMFDWFV